MNATLPSLVDNLLNPGEEASQPIRILAAAGRVFIEHGYTGTSMEDIAVAAAVTRRTLYNRFPEGKEALFMAVTARLWEAYPRTPVTGEAALADPAKGLRQIAMEFAGFWCGSSAADLLRMVVHERRYFPLLARSFDEATQTPTMNVISNYLAALGSSGILSLEAPQTAAKQFLMMINGQVLWAQTMCDGHALTMTEMEQLVDRTVKEFLSPYTH